MPRTRFPHRPAPPGVRRLRLGLREVRPTLALAVPIMAGMVSQMLLGLADTLMVGRLGVIPLAAASFVNILFHQPLIFGIGLLSSVPVLAAQAFGARDREAAGEILRHGLALSIALGLAMAGLLWSLQPLLGRLGQPEPVVAASGTYLRLVGASLFPLLVTHTAKQFSEALDRPWVPTIIMLAGVALNILLNWILIYGHWGAPPLGLEGAGWATLTARTVMVLAMMGWVLGAPALRPYHPLAWWNRWQGALWGRLWQLGWPVALQHLCEVGAFALCGLMMGWISAEALAAHQIALSCAATTFMFPLGLGMALCIRVGQAWGAGKLRRVRVIGHAGLAMGIAVMGVFGLFFMLGGEMIAGWFVEAPVARQLAAALLFVAAIFQVMDGTQVVSISTLRGMGDVKVPALIALLAYWIVTVPLAYLLAFPGGQGAVGVWVALAIGLGVAALLLARRFQARSQPRMAGPA